MSTETETAANGGSRIPSQADLANRAQGGRRRAAATPTTEPAVEKDSDDQDEDQSEDKSAEAGEQQAAATEEPKKTRRGPKPGSKRKAKEEPAVAAPMTLPEPSQLPLDYLIKCAKYLRTVRKQIEQLDE